MTFPVGFHQLHPDVSMNVQMNRWFNWVGDSSMLEEMRAIAPHIETYVDWKREFLQLAERALARAQQLKAAFYFRSAEFFMLPSDPDKRPTRQRFLELARSAYGLSTDDLQAVPYGDGDQQGYLPAYRFTPDLPKGAIVFFGGFDSYIEELIPIGFFLRNAGFEVVLFEGPGQGGALEDAGLPMTSEWEKPVGAVLDYFGLDRVTLLGLSLGGYFALRAAAFEPRVRRAIAFDIYDFLACNLHQTNSAMRNLVNLGLTLEAGPVVNALLGAGAQRKPVIEWGLQQGMHVTGTRSPFDYLQEIRRYSTADISARIEQDVLLLAGAEDHYVPLSMFYRQIEALTRVRSLTARLFKKAEHAQNHCQLGNVGLALRVIVDWLEMQQDLGRNADGEGASAAHPSG